jgi:hypothetical protein
MKRKTFYVCSAFDEKLISNMIEANSSNEAADFFIKSNKIKPETIFGPFFKTKEKLCM